VDGLRPMAERRTRTLAAAIEDQRLMSHQYGFGHDRTDSARKKRRSVIVYSHSSEILTFPGEGLRGTALVAARFG
jgi:hypothetical protein